MIPSLFTAELARQHRAELLALAATRPPHRPTVPLWSRLSAVAAGIVAAIRADAEAVHLGPVETACLTC